MQNCAFDPAFWQDINSIPALDRTSWVSNQVPYGTMLFTAYYTFARF